jgi:DNA-binding FadR family transcriptional regulator
LGEDLRLPPERDLARKLGVTRNAVRKALADLEAEGLIWRKVGKGTFVQNNPLTSPDFFPGFAAQTNPVEIMEVMQIIQPRIAAMSALRATTEQIEQIIQFHENCSEAQDIDSRLLWDSKLHEAIARSTQNSILIFISDLLYRSKKVWGPRKKAVFTPERWITYNQQHRELVRAIAERNPEKSHQLMAEHMGTVRKHLLGAD